MIFAFRLYQQRKIVSWCLKYFIHLSTEQRGSFSHIPHHLPLKKGSPQQSHNHKITPALANKPGVTASSSVFFSNHQFCVVYQVYLSYLHGPYPCKTFQRTSFLGYDQPDPEHMYFSLFIIINTMTSQTKDLWETTLVFQGRYWSRKLASNPAKNYWVENSQNDTAGAQHANDNVHEPY